jgi:hypothetical protein
MMNLTFRHKGREMSMEQWAESLKREAIDKGMQTSEEKIRGVASSIVDPETGKHAVVSVRRSGDTKIVLRTSGSAAFAAELERRLGLNEGAVQVDKVIAAKQPLVYLAHGSEDKETIVRPLAHRLMERGIDVWFDNWEIRSGDSLRQKMEEGLGNCTHFVVVLTPTSTTKPWVNAEIDAAFVRRVAGVSKLIALRCGIDVSSLSPFLAAQLSPEFRNGSEEDFERLVADIHGVSLKPPIGPKPAYVTAISEGIPGWSGAAAAVAKYLVCSSVSGLYADPYATLEAVAASTGLPEDDVLDAVSELEDAGLVEVHRSLGDSQAPFWPRPSLFVEFDHHFAGIDSSGDAVAIVSWVLNTGADGAGADEIAKQFSNWTDRQINSALNYLDENKLVTSSSSIDSKWAVSIIMLNDRSRRFVKQNFL